MNRLLDELKRKGYGGHERSLGLLDECADEIQRLEDRLGAYQTLCKDLWTWAVTVEGCQLPQDLYKELELTQIHGVTYPDADNAPVGESGHSSTAEQPYDERVPKNFQEGGTASTPSFSFSDGEGQ